MERKVVLITGAASGIGKATAFHLSKTGYRNFTLVDKDEENLKVAVEECKQLFGEVKICALAKDLSDDPFKVCKEIVEETLKAFNRLDILISNAGIIGDVNYARDLNENALDTIFNVNVFAGMALTKYALPHLADTKGAILYTSSIAGFFPREGWSPYRATKGALVNYAKCVALEEAPNGIRVNVISPGMTKTKMLSGSSGGELEKMRQKVPLKKLFDPEEIAQVAGFLVGENNSCMTGSNIVVDGGVMLTSSLSN